MKVFNKQKLCDHFKNNKSHSIYLNLLNSQIKCNQCEYELYDSLKFGQSVEENYLYKLRQLIFKEQKLNLKIQNSEFSNLNFYQNQNNTLLKAVIILSQLKQINIIFDKPLLRTDLTGFHQKIHSSFITSISRLFNNIQQNEDTQSNFEKFYFSLMKKSQKYGGYQSLNLQECFLDLIQISHNELKKQIKTTKDIRDSIFEIKESQSSQFQEISELSTNFTGKIRIEKSCSQCCYSNHFIQDFFQIKFQEIKKNDKNITLENRKLYENLMDQQEDNWVKKILKNCQGFKFNILDLIYIFLNQKETAKNSKNSFDFYDKLFDRFDFLDNKYKNQEEFPNFCQQCFNDLKISYSLIDLPNILIFGAQNIKQYKLEIQQQLNLDSFRSLNSKKNYHEFSSESFNKFQSLKDIQKQQDNYMYNLQSFTTDDKKQKYTYFKNKDGNWYRIGQSTIISIQDKQIDKIIKKLKNLNLCIYQKIVIEQQKNQELLNVDDKPSFVPRLLIQSLKENRLNPKLLLDNFFCDHLKLKPCYREIFGKYHINQSIQNQNHQDRKIQDLIQKLKHKNTTLLNYISESEILTIREINQLFKNNKLIVNYKVFQNPQQCNDCYKLIVSDQIKKIVLKAIICSTQEFKINQQNTQFFIEREWFSKLFEYLNSNKNIPKNSTICLRQKFDDKINKNFDQFKHSPYYNKFLVNVSENCLAVLLELFGGQIVFLKPFCQSIQSKNFELRQKNLNPNLEFLIKLVKTKQFMWCANNKNIIQNFIKIEQKIDYDLKLKFPLLFELIYQKKSEFQNNLKSLYENQIIKRDIVSQIIDNIPQDIFEQMNCQKENDKSLMQIFSISESNEQELYKDFQDEFEISDKKNQINFFSQKPNLHYKENQAINSFMIGDNKTERVSVDKILLEMDSEEDLSEENYHLNISQIQDKIQSSNSKELRLLCGQNLNIQKQQQALITIEQSMEQSNRINKVLEQLNLSFKINPLKKNQIKKISQFGLKDGIFITHELTSERSAYTKKSNWKESFQTQKQNLNLKKISKQNIKNLIKKQDEYIEKIKIFMPNRKDKKRKGSFLLIVSSNQKLKNMNKYQYQKESIKQMQENQKVFNHSSAKKSEKKIKKNNHSDQKIAKRKVLQSINMNKINKQFLFQIINQFYYFLDNHELLNDFSMYHQDLQG